MHASFPSIMKKRSRIGPMSILREGNLIDVSFHSMPKESTSAFPKTIALHHAGKLACTNFPYRKRTSAFPKKTFHLEGNITHANFLPITSKNTFP